MKDFSTLITARMVKRMARRFFGYRRRTQGNKITSQKVRKKSVQSMKNTLVHLKLKTQYGVARS